jgi:hypothetical protein
MHQFSMLYFSGMTEDHELWSDWATSLKKQGWDEPVVWLINVGRPASILLSQLLTMALPLVSTYKSNQNLGLLIELLEDNQQLDAFSRALQAGEERA